MWPREGGALLPYLLSPYCTCMRKCHEGPCSKSSLDKLNVKTTNTDQEGNLYRANRKQHTSAQIVRQKSGVFFRRENSDRIYNNLKRFFIGKIYSLSGQLFLCTCQHLLMSMCISWIAFNSVEIVDANAHTQLSRMITAANTFVRVCHKLPGRLFKATHNQGSQAT